MPTPDPNMSIALLSQAGESGRHLREALLGSGAPIVYEAQAAELDRDALERSGARVVVVNLDTEVEAHLDEVYSLLGDDRYNVDLQRGAGFQPVVRMGAGALGAASGGQDPRHRKCRSAAPGRCGSRATAAPQGTGRSEARKPDRSSRRGRACAGRRYRCSRKRSAAASTGIGGRRLFGHCQRCSRKATRCCRRRMNRASDTPRAT